MSGSSTSTARDTSLPPAIPTNTEKPRDPASSSNPSQPPPQKQQTGRQGNDKDADDARDKELSQDGPPEDLRYYLPTLVGRFVGYRPPGLKPPFEPLGIPPFSWLSRIPLKYENYIWSTVGSFVGIILIEIVMIRAFAGVPGNGLIVAAFGAGAVLAYSQFESPLAQPRSIIGGSAISCVISVGLTRLFRLSNRYGATSNLTGGELGSLGWINGALSMSLSLLAMQLTGTTHPPGGAAALVAATQGGAIMMSWRYIYVVMVSACLELGWALVWNVSRAVFGRVVLVVSFRPFWGVGADPYVPSRLFPPGFPLSLSFSRTSTTPSPPTITTTTTSLPPNLLPSYDTRRTSAEDATQPTGSPLPQPSAPGLFDDSARTPILNSMPRLTKRPPWPEGNRAVYRGARGSGTNGEIIGML
jgi:hypothetical protein